jgi:hypothetical protein
MGPDDGARITPAPLLHKRPEAAAPAGIPHKPARTHLPIPPPAALLARLVVRDRQRPLLLARRWLQPLGELRSNVRPVGGADGPVDSAAGAVHASSEHSFGRKHARGLPPQLERCTLRKGK